MADTPRNPIGPRLRDDLRSDRGASLAELLVYIIIMVILTALIAATFISGRGVQRDQKALADASNNAQLAAATIEGSVRNAAKIQVETTVFNGDLLVVKTRVGEDNKAAASWRCKAWFYDEPTRTIYERTDTPGPGSATVGITARPDLEEWRIVVGNVSRARDEGGNIVPIFRTTGVGGGAMIRFDSTSAREDSPVRINTTVIPRIQGQGIGEETCGEYL
ncbi:hypothetical protein [Sanguibacter sp. HDW7]|uniref:hypothetical protein n=1 Tax=Sanguibacter sp. HDW7 TaxID=2714931 RepID=UPI00140CB1CE|nr:hypothetical protein [Sanguibacter sp. HDW7]QIK83581.1 hypothetical protein G7063_08025 [Sanguibacter sp. HDW7]